MFVQSDETSRVTRSPPSSISGRAASRVKKSVNCVAENPRHLLKQWLEMFVHVLGDIIFSAEAVRELLEETIGPAWISCLADFWQQIKPCRSNVFRQKEALSALVKYLPNQT